MTKPAPTSPLLKKRSLQPLEEAAQERQEKLRATIITGIKALQAERDRAIDARFGAGVGRGIGGTPSSTDLLGAALRYEIASVMIQVAAGIYANIEPQTIRTRNVHAFCDQFRHAVEAKVLEKGARS